MKLVHVCLYFLSTTTSTWKQVLLFIKSFLLINEKKTYFDTMCPALWPRDFATSYSFFACSFSLTSPLYSVPFIILKLNDCYHGWILKGGGGMGEGG